MHFRHSLALWQQMPHHLQFLVQARLASTASTLPPHNDAINKEDGLGGTTGDNVNDGGNAVQGGHGRTKRKQEFPFPTHRHPTPHEIFHLDFGATQEDIKSRYYDLVRSHHPDSPHCRSLPSDMAHSRFSAIIKAYEILRNPHLHSPHSSRYPHPRHPRANHHPHYSYYAYDPDVWTAEMNRRRAEWRRNQEVWGRYHSYANANGARAGMGAEEEVQWERNGKNAKGFDGMKDPVVMGLGLGIILIVASPILFSAAPLTEQRHVSAAKALTQAREDRVEYGMERRKQIRRKVMEMREAEERAREDADTKAMKGYTDRHGDNGRES